MARTARKRRGIDTWKTKKWYEVLAPKMFGESKVGDTIASDPSELKGRIIETSMRDLTGDFSRQHMKLRFQIVDVKGDKAYTEFRGQSLSRAYMRSQIRRKTTRVEGVTDVETKDGQRLRVKTIALAVGRAQTAQEKLIRMIMSERVKEIASRSPIDQFVQDVVLGRVATEMYRRANKIYPLKRVEVRKTKVLGAKAKAVPLKASSEAAPG